MKEDRFETLRDAMFQNPADEQRFRDELLLCIMATDIDDEERIKSMQQRLEIVFVGAVSKEEALQDLNDRKALVLMECILQASSIFHATQYWDVYTKWNSRLFEEFYKAYEKGSSKENPADHWYQWQLRLFDDFAIPLSKRLCESRAFHKATIESYYNYAYQNRREWEEKGTILVVQMTEMAIAERVQGGKTATDYEDTEAENVNHLLKDSLHSA